MFAAEVMVPCLSTASNCRLDWAAISAMGGWVAATVTFFAVLLPYRQYRKERAEKDETIMQDARTQLRSMIPVITAAYAVGRTVPRQLTDPGIEPAEEEELFEWISYFQSASMPELAWHRNLAEHREAVAMFSLCIAALTGYKKGQLHGIASVNLLQAIRNLDAAARDVARLLIMMNPGLQLAGNLPEYFPEVAGE